MNYFKMDTHMHLDLYKNRDELVHQIELDKSYTIAVTNLPVLFAKYNSIYSDKKYVKFALGLHPELAYEYRNQIVEFKKLIKNTRYIGEVGLDFTVKDISNRNAQLEIFKTIINECNKYGDKILSVHSRKAEKEVNEILMNLKGKVILHWYTGALKQLEIAVENGFYFSINHHMVKSKKGQSLLSVIPLNRILLESDAPFTKTLNTSYNTDFMFEIYHYLGKLHSMTIESISKVLKENFKTILKLEKGNE